MDQTNCIVDRIGLQGRDDYIFHMINIGFQRLEEEAMGSKSYSFSLSYLSNEKNPTRFQLPTSLLREVGVGG